MERHLVKIKIQIHSKIKILVNLMLINSQVYSVMHHFLGQLHIIKHFKTLRLRLQKEKRIMKMKMYVYIFVYIFIFN